MFFAEHFVGAPIKCSTNQKEETGPKHNGGTNHFVVVILFQENGGDQDDFNPIGISFISQCSREVSGFCGDFSNYIHMMHPESRNLAIFSLNGNRICDNGDTSF